MLQIHSKKRNKLEHKRLHTLVYVKYYQALLWRYNFSDEIDPISLGDIKDSCNEWLVMKLMLGMKESLRMRMMKMPLIGKLFIELQELYSL